MNLQTVTITTQDNSEPRQFHLSPDKAKRFADKIVAKGGTASVGPLAIGDELAAMLGRLGITV